MEFFNGMQVVANPSLVRTVEVHRRPRKWARRVMYQRWREFDCIYEQRPSREVIVLGGRLVMHPALVEELKAAIGKDKLHEN